MPDFDNFKDQTTHAQPVETKPGNWKEQLSKQDKRFYHAFTAFKGAGLLVVGAAIVTGIPSLLTAGAFYGLTALAQGYMRAGVEQKAQDAEDHKRHIYNSENLIDNKRLYKNVARYLIQPF
jgi:hypothetical protein